MLKLEEESTCQLQILSLVSISKQVELYLKQVKRSPLSGTFIFFCFEADKTKLN